MTKRVALYLRVSTDEQTLENQRRELEAVAAREDWNVVATYEDNGVSGAKGRDRRPGFDALCRAVTRKDRIRVSGQRVPGLFDVAQELLEGSTLGIEVGSEGRDGFLEHHEDRHRTVDGQYLVLGVRRRRTHLHF